MFLLYLFSISVSSDPSIVYFSKQITSESIVKLYNALNQRLNGNVGIKISTGEKGGNNYLHPELIGDFVHEVNGTIVECNTFYEGARNESFRHWELIKEHGFLDIARCDILDEEGDIGLPVSNYKHMKEFFVGSHVTKYDSFAVLSHFKGHPMGGFGGALKNIAIGFGSSRGKCVVHAAGNTDPNMNWDIIDATITQTEFLETMAEAVSGFVDKFRKENLVYINVAYNLSVDCDCASDPRPAEMENIGIFASLDPIAIDQACVDAVYNSPDPGKESLIKEIEDLTAVHILEMGEKLGIGKRNYEVIEID